MTRGGIQIRGEIIGGAELVSKLRFKWPETVRRRVRDSVHALGFLLERNIKTDWLNGRALGRRSGRLARSVNTRFVDTEMSSESITGTSVSYGRIWELTGSRAFTILPKKAGALFWPGAAHPVAYVLHPAQAKRPFLKPALDELRPTVHGTLTRALANLDGAGA